MAERPSKRQKLTTNEKSLVELARQALLSTPEIALPDGSPQVKSVEDEDATIGVVLQYHCDFCGTDITNHIRIRCNECRDFDLCVECFCKGSEKGTHLNTHSYIPVGYNSFALFTKEWNADEELMLLEGVSKFGLGNWTEVADLVAPHNTTKIKKRDDCEKHYLDFYLNSATKPLPDISKILSSPSSALDVSGKELWLDDYQRGPSPSASQYGSAADAAVAAGIHVEGPAATAAQNLPKPQVNAAGKPAGHGSLIVGYMPLRGDFDIEYDNDAELILADVEFRENDPPHEKELKLKVLSIYNSKIDERSLRKRTIIERKLLDVRRTQILEKRRTKEERELHTLLKPLARFNIEANHERLVTLLLDERRLWSRLLKLQEWKAAGLKSSREVKTYEEEMRRRRETLVKCPNLIYIFEGAARSNKLIRNVNQKATELDPQNQTQPPLSTSPIVSGGELASTETITPTAAKTLPTSNRVPVSTPFGATRSGRHSTPMRVLPGANMCSEKELYFCEEIQLAPIFFLMAKSCLLHEVQKNGGLAGLDRDTFTKMLRLDVTKSGPVYDFVLDTELMDEVQVSEGNSKVKESIEGTGAG